MTVTEPRPGSSAKASRGKAPDSTMLATMKADPQMRRTAPERRRFTRSTSREPRARDAGTRSRADAPASAELNVVTTPAERACTVRRQITNGTVGAGAGRAHPANDDARHRQTPPSRGVDTWSRIKEPLRTPRLR